MPIVRSGESEYDKEMQRWETPRAHGGYAPNGYEEFPLMLSKAQKKQNGQYAVHEQPPVRWMYEAGMLGDAQWDQACRMAEEFTLRCQLTVRNQHEYDQAVKQGWVRGQDAALAKAEAWEKEIADAAAARHFADQRMSAKARTEAAEADAATSDHVPDVPRKRGRPRGRPFKKLSDD